MRPNAGDVDGLPSVLANHSNEFVGMLVATQLEIKSFSSYFWSIWSPN